MNYTKPKDDDLVMVCDACLRASCWYYEFPCEDAGTAGTTLKTVRELHAQDLEHYEYWSTEKIFEVYGGPTSFRRS